MVGEAPGVRPLVLIAWPPMVLPVTNLGLTPVSASRAATAANCARANASLIFWTSDGTNGGSSRSGEIGPPHSLMMVVGTGFTRS